MHVRRHFKLADPQWDVIEAQWMAQMAEGGARAHAGLECLYNAYAELFVKRLRFYGLEDKAEEVAHDLWMEIARAARRYRAESTVREFLLGVLRNGRRRHYADRASSPPSSTIDDASVLAQVDAALQLGTEPTHAGSASFDFMRCVRRALIAFEQSHPRLAKLLLLKHVDEMSIEELAAMTGRKEGDVKADLFGARNKLRPSLRPCLDLWPGRATGTPRGADD